MSVAAAGSIDAASMAAQLVSAERAQADARLDRTERQVSAQVSAVGTLRSAFSALRTAVNALSSNTAALARSTKLTSDVQFSATAGAGAPVGSYQVEVLALASAHKLASAGHATSGTAVGTGTLTIAAGAQSFDITIGEDDNSLEAIRDAINETAGSAVQASIVRDDSGHRLVLTGRATGTANALTVTANGGDGGLASLTWPPAAGSGMVESAAATDARVKVDGFERTSASNTISDMLPGVTMVLKKAEPGVLVGMEVGFDAAARLAAVKSFVNAYNVSLASIATTTSYNTETRVAAALNGDAMVRGTARTLRDTVGADVSALKAIGITIAKDGTLALDEAKFGSAVAADPDAASALFAGGEGTLGKTLDTTLDRLLDAGGSLDSRSESLTSRTRQVEQQRTALDRRMAMAEARYKAQFIALDSMITKLQNTSNFLTQQLSSATTGSQ